MRRPTKRQTWKAVFAVMATLAVLATVSPALTALVANLTFDKLKSGQASSTPTTSTTPAGPQIKPLAVRPVISAFVTTPEQCPPPTPTPADQPARECDIPKTAVYELSPEALRVDLTKVDSFQNPLNGLQMVQMTMTEESARKFGEFTVSQVGKQVAFVRDGTVVWGPKITTPIDGQILQLSGDLTPDQAEEVARMLREGA